VPQVHRNSFGDSGIGIGGVVEEIVGKGGGMSIVLTDRADLLDPLDFAALFLFLSVLNVDG
jgi:hypothetical protein